MSRDLNAIRKQTAKIPRRAFHTKGSTNTNALRWKEILYIRIAKRPRDFGGKKQAEAQKK